MACILTNFGKSLDIQYYLMLFQYGTDQSRPKNFPKISRATRPDTSSLVTVAPIWEVSSSLVLSRTKREHRPLTFEQRTLSLLFGKSMPIWFIGQKSAISRGWGDIHQGVNNAQHPTQIYSTSTFTHIFFKISSYYFCSAHSWTSTTQPWWLGGRALAS